MEDWTIIEKGIILPEDFIQHGSIINRDLYVLEIGFPEDELWYDENYSASVTLEMIAVAIIGGTAYKTCRFRKRTDSDPAFSLSNTLAGKIFSNTLLDRK